MDKSEKTENESVKEQVERGKKLNTKKENTGMHVLGKKKQREGMKVREGGR